MEQLLAEISADRSDACARFVKGVGGETNPERTSERAGSSAHGDFGVEVAGRDNPGGLGDRGTGW